MLDQIAFLKTLGIDWTISGSSVRVLIRFSMLIGAVPIFSRSSYHLVNVLKVIINVPKRYGEDDLFWAWLKINQKSI